MSDVRAYLAVHPFRRGDDILRDGRLDVLFELYRVGGVNLRCLTFEPDIHHLTGEFVDFLYARGIDKYMVPDAYNVASDEMSDYVNMTQTEFLACTTLIEPMDRYIISRHCYPRVNGELDTSLTPGMALHYHKQRETDEARELCKRRTFVNILRLIMFSKPEGTSDLLDGISYCSIKYDMDLPADTEKLSVLNDRFKDKWWKIFSHTVVHKFIAHPSCPGYMIDYMTDDEALTFSFTDMPQNIGLRCPAVRDHVFKQLEVPVVNPIRQRDQVPDMMAACKSLARGHSVDYMGDWSFDNSVTRQLADQIIEHLKTENVEHYNFKGLLPWTVAYIVTMELNLGPAGEDLCFTGKSRFKLMIQ